MRCIGFCLRSRTASQILHGSRIVNCVPPIAWTGIALGRDPLKAKMNRRKDNSKQKLFPDYCFETDFNIFEPIL